MGTHQPREEFLQALEGKLHFDLKQLAFCTHYSWFGVVKKERLGIEQLHLFYNRRPALLSPNLLTFHIDGPEGGSEWQKSRTNDPLVVEEQDGKGFVGKMAFLDSDILCYSVSLSTDSNATRVRATLLLPATEPRHERRVRYAQSERMLSIETRVPKSDARDPDQSHPLTLCLSVPEAFHEIRTIADGAECPDLERGLGVTSSGPLVISFCAEREALADSDHEFVLGIGEGPTADRIVERMRRVYARKIDAAIAASVAWLDKALDNLTLNGIPKRLQSHYAKAVYQLLCNTKAPRGLISRCASFPSRGTYCCHFLWDSCFVSQGLGTFNERLAEDALLALCENIENDGKMPHFVCATWNSPGVSQPPLVAWAAWNLYERFGNKEFLRGIYEPVGRMVDWWFANRDEDKDGLAEYADGLESGWDDSPRFDSGSVAAIDLNCFLYREMRMLAKMAPVLGRTGEGIAWDRRADEHSTLIRTRLFDREDGLFYDRLVAEDRLHKVLTPASFIPLWCGIKVAPDTINEMIGKYLTNPKHFFGSRPFPCVAYSDRNYEPEQWWRGPVWPNVAWVMTEILRTHGFHRERDEAVRRLLEMMAHPDDLSELYASSTGKPLGATALGWTCAVFVLLCQT